MRWIESPPVDTPPFPGLHPIIAQVLARRGMTNQEEVDAFLNPDHYTPSPASVLPGIQAAVERIAHAVHAGEHICVWGDFDVDGQTAATLLVQTLRSLEAKVTYHIPIRSLEGHGVKTPNLEKVINEGIQLLITCDTGITAHEASEYARSHGVDMIVTDHHDLPHHLPLVKAIVNPKMLPHAHPLASVAGVGTAFKLAEALIHELKSDLKPSDLYDLVALGMVADLALLKGDSRYLVQKGLEALRKTCRLGLQTLYELTELKPDAINEVQIGYTIAPRLNSIGRLGDANPIVDFLLTTDLQRARVLATQLENYNSQRRLLTAQVTQAAEARLQAEPSLLAAPIIIVGHPAWPAGVLGITASRLVERYNKPAIVFSSPPGEPVYGSARSVEGLHITEAIALQSDLLLNYGGHPMAAGFSIDLEKMSIFMKRMAFTVERMLGLSGMEEPTLSIDAWLTFPEINLDLAESIEKIAPFGPGNAKLILASRDITLSNATSLGRNKEHRKLIVENESGDSRQVLWWDGGTEELPEGKFDLAYTLRLSDWRGNRQLQMEYVGFRSVHVEPVALQSRDLEVIDFRAEKNRESVLQKAQENPSTIIWAEGEEKERVSGKDRCELTPADTLVIWSAPPSPDELKTAYEKVKPKTIWLVAVQARAEITEKFMDRLAGLIKYAISHREGLVTYPQLAAATGHRLETVQNGLAWLVARGIVGIRQETDDGLWLEEQAIGIDPPSAARLWTEVQTLLAESAAYRVYFKSADKDTLFT